MPPGQRMGLQSPAGAEMSAQGVARLQAQKDADARSETAMKISSMKAYDLRSRALARSKEGMSLSRSEQRALRRR